MAQHHTIRITSQCAYSHNSTQCRRRTTITHPYCAQHTRLVYGVEVRRSQIAEAGLGLWAVRHIPRNTALFLYEGERLSKREYNERYRDDNMGAYGIELNNKIIIDARRTEAGIARYICSYHGSGLKPNMEYLSDNRVITMWTIRNIEAGEELLADYGEEMMQALGIYHIID